jgi:hypothetical protein
MSVHRPSVPRRRGVLAVAAAAAASALLLTAAPADALVAPAWPAAGRLPTGCAPGVVFSTPSSTGYTYGFTDPGVPTVSHAVVGAGASPITVLTPRAGVFLTASLSLAEPCSGVQGATVDVTHNGAIIGGGPMTNQTGDAFSATWSWRLTGGLRHADDAGVYTIPIVLTSRRYNDFVLDAGFKLLTSTAATTGDAVTLVGAWAQSKSYVLRATSVTVATSAGSVAKGKPLTVSGVLKYATNTAYVADDGDRVLVQTRNGSGPWSTRSILITTATGAFSTTFPLTRTSQVRVVHPAVFRGRFTAGVTSVTKTVVVR